MFGAICGDYIGSPYERFNYRAKNFTLFKPNYGECRFTDDSILSIAIAHALMEDDADYSMYLRSYARRYPTAGYGGAFIGWVDDPHAGPYGSYGNGSAMRVSAVAYVKNTLDEVQAEAKRTAEVTHNHEEGIKGAQAVASCIFMARKKATKEEIKKYVEDNFKYDLNRKLDDIRPTYEFSATCPKSVPESIIAFLESTDYEDCIRNAISIGGDSDTIAAISGSIAEPFYGGVPYNISSVVLEALRKDAILYTEVERFMRQYSDVVHPFAAP